MPSRFYPKELQNGKVVLGKIPEGSERRRPIPEESPRVPEQRPPQRAEFPSHLALLYPPPREEASSSACPPLHLLGSLRGKDARPRTSLSTVGIQLRLWHPLDAAHPPAPRAEGRAGADSMSHVLGLELREAPPLLGPLLSPLPLPAGPGAARCCAATTDSPSPVRLGKGPRGDAARHRGAGQSNPGTPVWARSSLGGAVLAPDEAAVEGAWGGAGRRRGWGVRGGLRDRELPGEGQGAALLQEFPGIRLQRSQRESRVGRGAPRRTGPFAPSSRGSRPRGAVPAHTDPVWRGRSRALGPLCYGGAASTPTCRRVSAAASYCRDYPAPSNCRVCAGPGSPGRDSQSPFGGRGVSPPPSRLRDGPAPGDCGFIPAPGDRLVSVALGDRSIPEAAGFRRLPVSPSYSRDSSVAGDCRFPSGPGRWGGSGLRAFSGRPTRPQAR